MTVTPEDIVDEVINGADGVTLADVRKATGMTWLQVAKKMGVTKGRVGQIEADYPNVHHLVAQRYLEAVGAVVTVQVGELVFESSELVADRARKPTKGREYTPRRAIRRTSDDMS